MKSESVEKVTNKKEMNKKYLNNGKKEKTKKYS